MRAIWSGSISFGLVNIPVKLYSGAQSHSLDLDMLRKSDLCPVKYQRICEKDGQEIPYDEIVKGYEYTDGDYIVLTDDDFEAANIEQTNTLDIMDFVKESEIDSRYFEKPYYLEPAKGGAKPYSLLCEALKASKKVGVANFLLRNKGHLGIIKAQGNLIVLNQLRYADEIRKPDELNLPEPAKIKDKEVELALTLIDQLTTTYKPEKYKDTYVEDLKKIIEDKSKGKKPKAKSREPKPTKVVDMISLLKKSIQQKKKQAA